MKNKFALTFNFSYRQSWKESITPDLFNYCIQIWISQCTARINDLQTNLKVPIEYRFRVREVIGNKSVIVQEWSMPTGKSQDFTIKE